MNDLRVEVMLSVRDEHGVHTGRVDDARLRTANFTIGLVGFSSSFRHLSGRSRIAIRYRRFTYQAWRPHVGNYLWDRFVLETSEAAELLNYLRRRCGAMVETVSAKPDELFHRLSTLLRSDAAVTPKDLAPPKSKPPAVNMRHTVDYEAAVNAWFEDDDAGEVGRAGAIDWLIEHGHETAAELILSGELSQRIIGAIRLLAERLPRTNAEGGEKSRSRAMVLALPFLRPLLTPELLEMVRGGDWEPGPHGEGERPVPTQAGWNRWLESMALRK